MHTETSLFEDIEAIKEVVKKLSKLPSIGSKTALRLALYIINSDDEYAIELSDSIKALKEKISLCNVCNSFTENIDKICNICKDDNRDTSVVCVVEQPQDVITIEKLNIYKGKYFVLKGVIDPLNGINPEDIELYKLISYVNHSTDIKEVIIATNPTLKGETTANYIEDELSKPNLKVSRIAYGMPVGASIDYADSITLKRSFEGRTVIS